MIIDSHCHAGKGDGLTGPWDTDAPLGAYLTRAARAGIDRTVLFAAFTSDYRSANADVGRIVSADPGRFSGYAMVDAGRDRGRVRAMVAEAVTGWGACGIKVHRHDARITREVCEAALSFALPVLYDVMGETSTVELVAAEYPRVTFIIPHLGSFADDWRAQRVMIDVLARHPNVYTDTAGVRRFDLLLEAVQRAGPQKVIFGTDGPWLHPGVELSKVASPPSARSPAAPGAGWELAAAHGCGQDAGPVQASRRQARDSRAAHAVTAGCPPSPRIARHALAGTGSGRPVDSRSSPLTSSL